MPLARIADCGTGGVLRDQFAPELAPGAWSDVLNARFDDGYAKKAAGYAANGGTPTAPPYGIFYGPSATTRYFAYFGLDNAYSLTGTTHTDITRASGVYTMAATDKWVGSMLTGILVVTNGVDAPQSWVPGGATLCADLANWPASTTCKSIRAFKNHLIALDVTKSGTRYPYLIKWSHPADPGSLPSSYDQTDSTKDAGEIDLADTTEAVIDGAALNDVFVVFKAGSTYAMRYVGAPFIFSVQKISEQSGILARNCAVETPMGLVVLTSTDVVLLTGDTAPRSIIDGRNRRWLNDNINVDAYAASFVFHNKKTAEVFVCIPVGASLPDMALVWNYSTDTWSVRELPQVSSAALGFVSATSSPTIDSVATVIDSDTSLIDAGAASIAQPAIMLASPTDTKNYLLDGAEDANGTAQTTRLERKGMHLDAPEVVKLIRGVRPRIDGDTGATVSVYVGASMDVDAEPTWAGPYTFTIGSTLKVDTLVSGRWAAVRFESSAANKWSLRSFDIDYVLTGQY